MNDEIQVHIKQVWKRKEDGLLVRVSGLIFVEPKRIMWQALTNQHYSSAHEITTETEFKQQYEYKPEERAGQNR